MHPQPGTSFRSLLGIPPSTPSPADSTLLIIDAQNEYDHGALAIHEVKKSRAVIAEVLKKYRDAGGDVVHVVQQTPPGAPLFTPGTELAEEFEELRPGDSGEEVITKMHPCAFSGTDLDAHLKKGGKGKIVLVGYMAHVCISSTARIGAELGYETSVVSDAIGDRDIPGAKAQQLVDTVLSELADSHATIIKSDDL